jgi:CubicO group peptidase (beta-lactamase class C family)
MKQALRLSAAAASLLLLLSCTAAIKPPREVRRGDYSVLDDYGVKFAEQQMRSSRVTGMSIAIVDDQRVVWSRGLGFADAKAKKPATPQTLYRVGSISKLINACAVLRLQEQGKLDIDQPLTACLPEFAVRSRFPGAPPITLRTMLTHHSGLPGDLLRGFTSRGATRFQDNVALLKDEYVPYPPNYVWAYSNLAISLLGTAVERVSGKDYVRFTDEQVLAPLAMSHSSFALRADMESLASRCYLRGKETTDIPIRDIPAGALWSSVEDLGRLMMMVFSEGRSGDGQFLSPGTLTEMLTPQNLNVPLDGSLRMGLGFFLTYGDRDFSYAGGVAEHGGDTKFFHSEFIALPESKLGIIVLTNSLGGARAARKTASELLRLAVEAKTGLKPPETRAARIPVIPISVERAQTLVGSYGSAVGMIRVKRSGTSLSVNLQGLDLALKPLADSTFGLELRLLGFIPITLPGMSEACLAFRRINGEDVVAARARGMEMPIGKRIEPYELTPAWKARLGRYALADTTDDVITVERLDLKLKDGFLMADARVDNEDLSLVCSPLSDSEAVFWGLGRNMMETVRGFRDERVECLRYSGYTFRRVK